MMSELENKLQDALKPQHLHRYKFETGPVPDLSAQIDAAEGLAEALQPATAAVVRSALKEQLDKGDLLFRAKEALRRAKHDHERALMTEAQERSDMVTRHVAAARSRERQIRIAEHNLQRVRDAEGLVTASKRGQNEQL